MFQAVKIKAYLKYGEPFLDILQEVVLKLPDCLIFGSRPAKASNFVALEKLSKLFVSPNIIAQAIIFIPGTDSSFVSILSTVSDILDTITEKQYQEFVRNIQEIREKLKKGFYLKKAINEILS